jgi:peptidyl-prolyl cis-trans isomerase A (cyclophilin A)
MREWKNSDGERLLPSKLVDELSKRGCAITMAGFYTIFGQTIEGFDVIEAICGVEVEARGVPEEEIKIISIELEVLYQ